MQFITLLLKKHFKYLNTNFMCFWWGNFHFLKRKWFIHFPQYCCLAFNNLKKEQRKRERPLQWKCQHNKILNICTCKISIHVWGRVKTRKQIKNTAVRVFLPPRSCLTLFISLSPLFVPVLFWWGLLITELCTAKGHGIRFFHISLK